MGEWERHIGKSHQKWAHRTTEPWASNAGTSFLFEIMSKLILLFLFEKKAESQVAVRKNKQDTMGAQKRYTTSCTC